QLGEAVLVEELVDPGAGGELAACALLLHRGLGELVRAGLGALRQVGELAGGGRGVGRGLGGHISPVVVPTRQRPAPFPARVGANVVGSPQLGVPFAVRAAMVAGWGHGNGCAALGRTPAGDRGGDRLHERRPGTRRRRGTGSLAAPVCAARSAPARRTWSCGAYLDHRRARGADLLRGAAPGPAAGAVGLAAAARRGRGGAGVARSDASR